MWEASPVSSSCFTSNHCDFWIAAINGLWWVIKWAKIPRNLSQIKKLVLVLGGSWLLWQNFYLFLFFVTNFMHHFMQVVREIQHSRNGVTVTTEDGCIYEANYVVLSVSIGVLQSDLISFTPPLPVRFLLLFIPCCLWLYYLLITLWLSPPPRPRMPPIIYDDVSYLLPLDLWTSIERPKMGGGESWPFNIHNTINISRALSVL